VPLASRGSAFGALTLVRGDAEQPSEDDLALCEHLACIVGPILELKYESERPWHGRLRRSVRDLARRVTEPGHIAAKLGAGVAAGLLLGLLFVPVFNVYWWFRVWAGFATALNGFRARQGLEGRASKGIAVTFTISWIGVSPLGVTPWAPIVCIFEGVMLTIFVAHAGRLVSDIAGFSSTPAAGSSGNSR